MATTSTVFTDKVGRYAGPGDPLGQAVWGDHAPTNSPFYYMPTRLGQSEFFYWDLNVGGFVAAHWTETLVDVGAGTSSVAPAAGGLVLTTADTENDGAQVQMLRAFTPAANMVAIMYCRVQVSDATQTDLALGFVATDTTAIPDPSVSAHFQKVDGAATVTGVSNDGGTASATSTLFTASDATEYDLGVVVNGTTDVKYCYKAASSATWSMTSKTTDLPNAAVRPTLALLTGEGGSNTMTLSRCIFAWML